MRILPLVTLLTALPLAAGEGPQWRVVYDQTRDGLPAVTFMKPGTGTPNLVEVERCTLHLQSGGGEIATPCEDFVVPAGRMIEYLVETPQGMTRWNRAGGGPGLLDGQTYAILRPATIVLPSEELRTWTAFVADEFSVLFRRSATIASPVPTGETTTDGESLANVAVPQPWEPSHEQETLAPPSPPSSLRVLPGEAIVIGADADSNPLAVSTRIELLGGESTTVEAPPPAADRADVVIFISRKWSRTWDEDPVHLTMTANGEHFAPETVLRYRDRTIAVWRGVAQRRVCVEARNELERYETELTPDPGTVLLVEGKMSEIGRTIIVEQGPGRMTYRP